MQTKKGRPRKKNEVPTEAATVEVLASKGCTQSEICDVIGVSVDTFQRRQELYNAWKRGVAKMKTALRQQQFQRAMGGNTVMLIWLGKQYLGQSDKAALEVSQKPENSPEWANMRSAIAAALKKHPEARQAVIEALKELKHDS